MSTIRKPLMLHHDPSDPTKPGTQNPTSDGTETGRDARSGAFAQVMETAETVSGHEQNPRFSFQAIIDALPQIFWTTPPSGGAAFCNGRFFDYTGLTFEEVQGAGWANIVHPEDLPGCLVSRRESLERGTPWEYEYRLRRHDGEYRWFLARAEPVRNEAGQITCWVGTATDHHEHRLAEERERFLAELTERTRAVPDPDTVVEETLRAVGGFMHLSRFLYADVDREKGIVTARREFFEGRGIENIGRAWPLSAIQILAEELSAGRTTINGDTAVDPRTAGCYEAVYRPADVRAVVTVPLLREGRWIGYFSAMTPQPRNWAEEEIALLEAAAERMWVSMESARLYRETRARAEREALINQIGDGIRLSLPPEEIEALAIRALGNVLSADRCYLMALDLARDSLSIARDWCADGVPSIAAQYRASDLGVDFAALFATGETLVVPDARPESERRLSDQNAATNKRVGVTSFLNVPYFEGDRIVGALGVAMASGARDWTEEEVTLAETVAGQLRSAVEAVRLQQRERNIAHRLQEALQPAKLVGIPGLALASHYLAALGEAEVGGDFYDTFELGGGRFGLVVADLAGKGLSAASQVAMIRNQLRYALYTADLDQKNALAAAVERLNGVLAQRGLLTGFATLFAGIWDDVAGTLSYVNAGQEPGLIWRATTGEVDMLLPTGPVLGGFEGGKFTQHTVALAQGDVWTAFSDGMTEIGPSRKELLGIDGVVPLFAQSCSLCAAGEADRLAIPDQVLSRLIAAVEAFTRGKGMRDDLCALMAVRRLH